MADHLIEDMLPEVRRQVKNCPDITLTYALLRAIRIFCRESFIYEKTLTLPMVNDLDVYRLDLAGNDEVIYVRSVQYNQYPLQSMRPEDTWFIKTGDQPFVFFFEPPDLLYLRPVPHNVQHGGPDNGPAVCLVQLVLQPKEGSLYCPEKVYRTYKEAVCAGAIAWCLMTPGEAWTDPQLGQLYEQKFMYGISEAKRHRLFGHDSRSLRARPRSFLVN